MTMLVELPHPGVLVPPEDRDAVDAAGQHLSRRVVEDVPPGDVQTGGLEQVAPRAQLELVACRVAVADRP
jgi:hypothetical protein